MGSVAKKAAGMSRVRRKQMIILMGLVVVVGALAFGAALLGGPTKKHAPLPTTPETTRKAFGAPGEVVNNADVWRTQEGARVTQLQQQLGEIQKKLEVNEKIAADQKAREESASSRKEQDEKAAREREQAEAARRAALAPPATGLPPQQSAPPGQPPGPPGAQLAGAHPSPEPVRGIMRVDLSSSPGTAGKPGQPSQNKAAAQSAQANSNNPQGANVIGEQTAETYIPAGSFMRGVLLVGLDAPTGGQAQQNPHPVVIEILDLASLPNKFKSDYKNCRVTANGAGDLSSERAYIRLDRMSCITEDGGAIDVAVRGYIADQTGKAGIRGRLVTKQGQVLANSLIAGVAAGIGNAFAQGAMTTSVSPLGSTTTVNQDKQLQAGLGQGVGTALNQLSRYYIQLAEKMFPVIEVDSGQPVDVVLTRGVMVARK